MYLLRHGEKIFFASGKITSTDIMEGITLLNDGVYQLMT